MKSKLLYKIEFEILALKKRLRELEPHIKYNAALAVAYNRTLVEKAILVDKYKKLLNKTDFGCKVVQKVGKKVNKFFNFTPKKRLICDFFAEGV